MFGMRRYWRLHDRISEPVNPGFVRIVTTVGDLTAHHIFNGFHYVITENNILTGLRIVYSAPEDAKHRKKIASKISAEFLNEPLKNLLTKTRDFPFCARNCQFHLPSWVS